MKAQELKDQIASVHAIPLTKGYRVEIELKSGERIVIKEKGTKAPLMVQLYDSNLMNGNAGVGSPEEAGYFKFAKNVDSWYKEIHLKSYPVEVVA